MAIDFRHILVPIDFGEPSQCALAAAIELARRFDAKLTLLHVYEIPAYAYSDLTYDAAELFAAIEQAARESLNKSLRDVQQKLPPTKAVLRRGSAATEILAAIDELHPDLVVIGTRGRTGVKHAFLGSVAEKVVRTSPVPVLTMHAGPRG